MKTGNKQEETTKAQVPKIILIVTKQPTLQELQKKQTNTAFLLKAQSSKKQTKMTEKAWKKQSAYDTIRTMEVTFM